LWDFCFRFKDYSLIRLPWFPFFPAQSVGSFLVEMNQGAAGHSPLVLVCVLSLVGLLSLGMAQVTEPPTPPPVPSTEDPNVTTVAPATLAPNYNYSNIPFATPAPSGFIIDAWLIAVIVFFGVILFSLSAFGAYRQKQKRNREKEAKLRQEADAKFRTRMSEMERRIEKL
jgi:hypothetical protein